LHKFDNLLVKFAVQKPNSLLAKTSQPYIDSRPNLTWT